MNIPNKYQLLNSFLLLTTTILLLLNSCNKNDFKYAESKENNEKNIIDSLTTLGRTNPDLALIYSIALNKKKHIKLPKNKLKLYFLLYELNYFHNNYERSQYYLGLAKSISDASDGELDGMYNFLVGNNYYRNKKIDSANYFLLKSLNFENNSEYYNNALRTLGSISTENNDYQTALNYENKLLIESKKTKNNERIATSYLYLFYINLRLNKTYESKKYLDSMNIFSKKDKLPYQYFMIGLYNQHIKKYDTALKYYNLELAKNNSDPYIYIKKIQSFNSLNKVDSAKNIYPIIDSLISIRPLNNFFHKEYLETKLYYGEFNIKEKERIKNEYSKLLNEIINKNYVSTSANYIYQINMQKEAAQNDKILYSNRQQKILIICLVLIVLIIYLFFRKQIIKKNLILKNSELEIKNTFLQSQLDERQRIYSELHDDLGSYITTITLASSLINKQFYDPKISAIHQNSLKMYRKLKEIVWDLNKELTTIEELISNIKDFSGEIFGEKLFFNFKSKNSNSKFNSTEGKIFFLVVKEIFNNILKHSKFSTVDVKIINLNNTLKIIINDDGIGFEYDLIKNTGKGMTNIAKNIQNIGGHITIDSKKGKGSKFVIIWYYGKS